MSFFTSQHQGPPSITQAIEIARGVTPEGKQFSVSMVQYDRKILGKYDESCVVTVGGNESVVGFLSWEDARRYVGSMEEEEYEAYDANGNKGSWTRAGLGVPPGMIVETLALKSKESLETPATSVDMSETDYEDPSYYPSQQSSGGPAENY